MRKQQYKIFLNTLFSNNQYSELFYVEVNKIIRLQCIKAIVFIFFITSVPTFLGVTSLQHIWGGWIAQSILITVVTVSYKRNNKKRELLRNTRENIYLSNRIRYILKKEIKLSLWNVDSLVQNHYLNILKNFTIQEVYSYFYKSDSKDLKNLSQNYINGNIDKATHSDIVFFEKEKNPDFSDFLKRLLAVKKQKLAKSISDF